MIQPCVCGVPIFCFPYPCGFFCEWFKCYQTTGHLQKGNKFVTVADLAAERRKRWIGGGGGGHGSEGGGVGDGYYTAYESWKMAEWVIVDVERGTYGCYQLDAPYDHASCYGYRLFARGSKT